MVDIVGSDDDDLDEYVPGWSQTCAGTKLTVQRVVRRRFLLKYMPIRGDWIFQKVHVSVIILRLS